MIRFNAILISLLIILSAFDGIMIYQHSLTPQQQFNNALSQISVGLTVNAYHSGQTNPYATRYLPHDLITDKFNQWITDIFGTMGTSITAISGLTQIGTITNGACSNAYALVSNYCGVFFEIGTGTGTSKGDTVLTTPYTPSGGALQFADTATNPTFILYSSGTTANGATCNTGSTDTITGLGGSQTITGSVTITEAGLFIAYSVTNVLFFHDDFTGISASSGDTVAISYTINLSNAGLTTNFCNFLAGYLAGNFQGGTSSATDKVQFSMINTGNTPSTFDSWCIGGSYKPTTTTCTSTSAIDKMGIGTGNTAFTPASYQLNNEVGSPTTITADAYSSPTCYWTTSITVGTTNTILESGMFITLSGNNYLMFAITGFSGQTQTASVPFPATIRSCN
jgi:hypothetical protein